MRQATVVGAMLALSLAGCQASAQQDRAGAPPVGSEALALRESMKDIVAPAAQTLWDVGSKGMNDEGAIETAKLADADWTSILAAAEKLKAASDAMAGDARIAVARPGDKIQDEGQPGSSSAAQVQGFIDADPSGFRAVASVMSGSAAEFIAAARTRDGARLGKASEGLDQLCEGCHQKFWYPQNSPAPK